MTTALRTDSAPDAPLHGYGDFLVEIKSQIRQRQFQAMRAANHELLALYWWLGENISLRQATLGWGKAVVETLARDLQAAFPGRNGFSARNLWNTLDFYRAYADKPKLQPLVAEISWAKNLVIMARCKDDLEREFYLRATARFGWTNDVLQHQLDSHSYQQYLNGQTNFDAALPDTIKAQALLAVKDHYTFDFLGLADEHSERELEQARHRHLPQQNQNHGRVRSAHHHAPAGHCHLYRQPTTAHQLSERPSQPRADSCAAARLGR